MPGVTVESPGNMASITSKSPAESGAGAQSFSYAQAAKGRTTPATSTAQSTQAPSGTNTPKIPASASDTSAASANGTISTEDDRSASTTDDTSIVKEHVTSEAASKPIAPTLSPIPSSSATTSPSASQKEDDSQLPPHLADASWRSARPKSSTEHPLDGSERRGKGKKSKKEKATEKEAENEKVKEDVKPETLVAAPVPTVNIWQQRKEAAAAKIPSVAAPSVATHEQTVNDDMQEQASKVDSKKKNRPFSTDSPVGTNAPPSKVSKKSSEGGIKKDTPSRGAPRGQRIGDKEEKTAAFQAPPPVEDAVSWPTPEIAVEEDKRQAQEKVVKVDVDESAIDKPRVKKPEWVTVPFVPSVTFNTQLPVRGGRGRGGGRGGRETPGRGGHGPSGSVSGDKTFTPVSADNSASQSHERARDSGSSNRATSLPPNASKKAAGDATVSMREHRKPSTTPDKSKVDASGMAVKADDRHSRLALVAPQGETPQESTFSAQIVEKRDQVGNASSENQAQSKSPSVERKGDLNVRSGEHFNGNGHSQSRERGEARGGRGSRAGGRGGYNNFANGQTQYTNGHPPPNGFGYIRQNSVPYSPTSQQNQQYGNGFAQNNKNRNGQTRAQSIPNGAPPMYGGYSRNGPGGMHINPMQGYDYPGQVLGPYVDYSVLPMVIMQMDYYFSIDNLCKDVYLRKHMDTQGFVFLSFIGTFKRIQSLTPDVDLLRIACQESDVIEIVTGDDGLDRVRRKDGWEKWVMPWEERDEGSRNAGPQHFVRQPSFVQYQQTSQQRMMGAGQAMSPPLFSPNGTELNFRPFMPGPPAPMANGAQYGEYGHQTESPLSAAVPDFNPGIPIAEKSGFADSEVTFTDAEVDALMLVWTPGKSDTKAKAPYNFAASRTFSNGSIDSRSIAEELQKPKSTSNGIASSDSSPESLRRSRSPISGRGEPSPTKQLFGNAPPVMWIKGQNVPGALKDSNTPESYNLVRGKALHTRQNSAVTGEVNYDMKVLYDFWPHFLVRNFNPRMYEEFRNLAIEDAQQNTYGMESLIAFYDETLLSKRKTINDILARHYVELVGAEAERSPTDRLGLAKLRSAWRNGALDLKSRKKINDLLDPKLREELER